MRSGLAGSGRGLIRSAESRQRYLEVYDHVQSLNSSPDAVRDVPTEFGAVRVYQHGLMAEAAGVVALLLGDNSDVG